MSVCLRLSKDKRRTSDRIPASVDLQQLPGATPRPRPLLRYRSDTWRAVRDVRTPLHRAPPPGKAAAPAQRRRPPMEQLGCGSFTSAALRTDSAPIWAGATDYSWGSAPRAFKALSAPRASELPKPPC